MNLWRRIFTENRISTTLVVTGLLTTTVFYFGGVYPLERRVDQTRALNAGTSRELDDVQAIYEKVRARLEREELTTADIERFYAEILPKDLPTARDIAYVKLADLAATKNLVMERRNTQSVLDEFGGLVRLQTDMLLAGQWADIRSFIATLEGGSDFLVIEDIVLSQREDRAAPVALAIEVATYYRGDV